MEKIERNLEIVKLYNDGMSMTGLVELYHLHRSTIQAILLRNGVKLHKNKSFINCNKNFFNEYNLESCYWAGFILADGNLRKNRNSLQIKLANKDKEHLVSFLKIIKCNDISLIKQYKDYVSLTISLDKYKNDLMTNFDITPQKTYECVISSKIPIEMLKHFIRGYMDGDGCVYTKNNIIALSFVGTVSVLTSLTTHFNTYLNIILKSKNIVPPINKLKNGVGSIIYTGKNSLKILDYLYLEVYENIFLTRKFIKYENYKKRKTIR